MGLNKGLGFTAEAAKKIFAELVKLQNFFVDAGVLVSTAFVSPYIEAVKWFVHIVKEGEFIEIYVSASLEVCETRDTKGLIQKSTRR